MKFWPILILIWLTSLSTNVYALANTLTPLTSDKGELQSANTFSNGGFENGTGNLPLAWSTSAWRQSTANFVWDNSAYATGARSVKIVLPSPNDARWTQQVLVNPCMNYRLSGWIKTQDVAQTAEVNNFGAHLSISEDSSSRTESLIGTNNWTYKESVFSVGNTREVSVNARLGYSSGTTTGTAWFDDINLEELPTIAIALNNPGFEVGNLMQPVGWQSEIIVGDGTTLITQNSSRSGTNSAYLSLTNPGVARWKQQIAVEPDTEYVLSGWIKSSNVISTDGRNNGAKLAVYGIPQGILEESTSRIQGTTEWKFVCQSFITGSVTKATIACTLGEQAPGRDAELNTGAMWCDDVQVVKKRTFSRTQIQHGHIALDFYSHIYEKIKDPNKYLDIMNEAYNALSELTGIQPFDGAIVTIRTEASMYAGGRSGNPIKLPPTPRSASINNLQDVDAVAIHELGHTFDLVPHSNLYRCRTCTYDFINGEAWTFFYSIYAYERIAKKYPELQVSMNWEEIQQRVPLEEVGKRMVAAYAVPWLCQSSRNYRDMEQRIYPSLLYSIQQKVGWQAFKDVFREYRDNVASIPVPPTEEEKVKLWAVTLSKTSQQDLLPYFQGWGFPVGATQAVSYSCINLPFVIR